MCPFLLIIQSSMTPPRLLLHSYAISLPMEINDLLISQFLFVIFSCKENTSFLSRINVLEGGAIHSKWLMPLPPLDNTMMWYDCCGNVFSFLFLQHPFIVRLQSVAVQGGLRQILAPLAFAALYHCCGGGGTSWHGRVFFLCRR